MSGHIRGRLALSVLLWTGAAGGAAGQSSDPVPPGTLVFGPVRITPSFSLRDMGVDNNIKNEAVNPKSDFTFTAAARADILFRMRRLKLGYSTTTDYTYFHTYESERGTNTSSAVRADFDLGFIRPFVTASGLSTKARPNTEIDERARRRDVIYSAGTAFKLASRTSVRVSGTQGTLAYDPDEAFRGVQLSSSLDGRRRTLETAMDMMLTPLTTLSVGLSREEQRFSQAADRDTTSWRIAPALTFSPDGLLTGTASVGYRRFTAASPGLENYSGLVSSVAVGATIYGRNKLQGAFTRDVQYWYDTATAYYLSTGGNLAYTLLLVGPFDVRALGSRTVMDYTIAGQSAGRDRSFSYGGGGGVRITSRARLGVTVEWQRRRSDRSADRDFRNHRVPAGLTWGT